jgi:hypothetical protein
VASVFLFLGLLMLNACGGVGTRDQGVPEYVEHNQKPVLSCSIKKVTGDTIGSSRIVSSDPRLSKLGSTLTEGDSVLFDCSQCKDDTTSPQDLKFELSQNYDLDNPVFEALTEGNMHRLDMNTPGRPIMALRVTDQEGASTTVPFTMAVQCAQGTAPDIGDVSLDVSSGGDLNMYNFQVNAANVGAGLKVSLDFNGDGVFDTPEANKFSTWTTNTSFTKYVQFVGQRSIGLKVANACELEATKQVVVNFTKDNLPRVPGTKAVRTGFPYVQYNLYADSLNRLGNEAKFLFTNGDVVHSEVANDSTMKAFANFTYYEGAETADSGTEYRFYANFDGYHDGCSSQGTKVHDAVVKTLSVVVGGTTDGVPQKVFTAEDVPAEIEIVCLQASYGCSGPGTSGMEAARYLLATIPDAQLTTIDGETATFEVGLISADRGLVNYTCGYGGGGGGGTGTASQ